jgi:hypothetical protein
MREFQQSRRDFLRNTVNLVSFGAVAAAFGPLVIMQAKEALDKKGLEKYEKDLCDYVQDFFGLKIELGKNEGEKNWRVGAYELNEETSLYVKCRLLEKLISELYFYPKGFLKQYFKTINITKVITHGLYGGGRIIQGAYTPQEETIIINKPLILKRKASETISNTLSDFASFFGGPGLADFRRIAHHEWAHSYTVTKGMELTFQGIFGKSKTELIKEELLALGEEENFLEAQHISEYSTTNELEDIAETLSYMFAYPELVKKACEKSLHLKAKINFLKKFLYRITAQKIDQKYWELLDGGKIDKNYFYAEVPTIGEYIKTRRAKGDII